MILQEGHLDRWNVAQSAFLGHLLYDLSTVFDKLMLVVSHPAMKDNDDIDVGATRRPEPIHARASRCNRDFSLQEVRLLPTVPIVKGVLDPLDHLVPRVQVRLLHALLLIHYSHDLFSLLQGSDSGLTLPAVQAEDHVGAPHLLIFLDLLSENALFVPAQILGALDQE